MRTFKSARRCPYRDVRAARPPNAAGSTHEIKLVSRVRVNRPGTAAKSPAFKAGIALLLSSLGNCYGIYCDQRAVNI